MNNKERAELKDAILHHAVETKEALSPNKLFTEINNPLPSLDHFRDLLDEMYEMNKKDFDCQLDPKTKKVEIIGCNNFTQDFLDKGGFLNQYESELKAENEEREMKKYKKRQLKAFWIPILISTVGVIIAIASFFKPSNDISQEVMSKNIDSLQGQLKLLQNGLQKDNDSLRGDLLKAEVLVKTLIENKEIIKK